MEGLNVLEFEPKRARNGSLLHTAAQRQLTQILFNQRASVDRGRVETSATFSKGISFAVRLSPPASSEFCASRPADVAPHLERASVTGELKVQLLRPETRAGLFRS